MLAVTKCISDWKQAYDSDRMSSGAQNATCMQVENGAKISVNYDSNTNGAHGGCKSSKVHVSALGGCASESWPLDRTDKVPTGSRERPVTNRKSFERCAWDICSRHSQK